MKIYTHPSAVPVLATDTDILTLSKQVFVPGNEDGEDWGNL